jgi:hypothetical protein
LRLPRAARHRRPLRVPGAGWQSVTAIGDAVCAGNSKQAIAGAFEAALLR